MTLAKRHLKHLIKPSILKQLHLKQLPPPLLLLMLLQLKLPLLALLHQVPMKLQLHLKQLHLKQLHLKQLHLKQLLLLLLLQLKPLKLAVQTEEQKKNEIICEQPEIIVSARRNKCNHSCDPHVKYSNHLFIWVTII